MTRINTNVQSLIARRAIGVNNDALNQSLKRLSTGLRINTGGDDPAGLIASEVLRSSIRAISSAIDNATRADTIVAVAEGALQEISSLMLELEALIDQSANESGLTSQEVSANQLQIDAILQSINRLADSSAFGDSKLLNGNLDFVTSGVNINEPTGTAQDHLDKVQINAAKIATGSFRQVNVNVVTGSQYGSISATGGAGTFGTGAAVSAVTIQIAGNLGSDVLSFASGTTAADVRTAVNDRTALTGVSAILSGAGTAASPTSIVFTSANFGSQEFVSVSIIQEASTDALALPGGATEKDFGADGTVTINGTSAIVSGLNASVRSAALSMDLTLSRAFGSTASGISSFEITGGGATFSISPTVGLSGLESVGISEVTTSKLGSKGTGFLSTLGSGLSNDLSSKKFTTAQRIVRESINQVASLRGRLGAFQKNTLGSTINSLQVSRENITAAESAIRDADFAVETSNLTRAQILVNASTIILQIANAQPQNVLALLG